MLLAWASAGGYELLAGRHGPHGLTAVHLAAALNDGGKMALLLTGTMLALVLCGLVVLQSGVHSHCVHCAVGKPLSGSCFIGLAQIVAW